MGKGNLKIEVRYEDEKDFRLLAVGCSRGQISSLAGEVSILCGIQDIRISVTEQDYDFKQFTL